MIKNMFNKEDVAEVIQRINQLSPQSKALWGIMSVSKMLAHCCVTYEYIYENKHAKPSPLKQFILRTMVKRKVVNETPYRRSNPTAPDFIIKDERDFEVEKKRLISYIQKTLELGEEHFRDKESLSFGILHVNEWNNMFYKHLNHHLTQFGV